MPRIVKNRLAHNEVLQVVSALGQVDSEDELLTELACRVKGLAPADSCEILLKIADGGLMLRASTMAPEYAGRARLGRGVGITGSVLETGEPLVIASGLANHPEQAYHPVLDESPLESAVVLPICSGEANIGVILLRRLEPWNPKRSELARLLELAQACAVALQGARRSRESQARVNRLGALSEVTKIIAGSPYLEEILQLLVNITAQQFNYRVCTVRLLDESNSELVLRATQATDKAYQRKRAIKLGESIAGRAIAKNRPAIVSDVQQEADYIGHDLAVEQGLRSMICVPLSIQNRALGVMSCYTDTVREFPEDEIKALETIAKQAAMSIENAKLQVRHTLMQEMHHRVKNNLQQVASLLRLQMRQSDNMATEEALNDSLGRILAIASVHDLLSREDLDHVGIRSVAEALVHHQQQSLILPGKKIAFEVRGDDVRLNMNQATQVALGLNELIQNAVGHGFEVSDEGDVHITVEELGPEVSVWVSNNGDALPEGFDMASSSHLGLNIVENLVRALGGKFKIGDILGWTVAELKFTRASSD